MGSADLSGARKSVKAAQNYETLTSEELVKKCPTLTGATMPDGKKYEDWLKDHEG